jgi:hypothetical protein
MSHTESETVADGINELNEQRMRRAEAAVHMVMYCLAVAVAAWLLVERFVGGAS